MISRTLTLTAATAGALTLALASAGPVGATPRADDDKAMVSVFHAVPGLTVDVYANGEELLPDFKPGTLTEPQELPAGSYDLKVFKDGDGPDGSPALQKKIEVPAGADATVVAHLSADGKPQLNAFVNDVTKVPAGKSRLTVRHVAAAPAVDVRAAEKPVFEALENPKEAKTEVKAGTVPADVVLAGTDTVAVGPADVNLKEGTSNVVYAWGSADDKNLALKVQSFDGMHSAPGGVDAGYSGAAAANSAHDWPAWGAAAGLLVVAGALTVRRRARRHA
ncbi:DUF4397 domain-containing protein [Streptomyces flavofungini]|uniref:DUF4397 domain-containing protein n=1 Tax=Streptomyces flavofungini TaxID=68200 RepID=A0ABS0XAW0_9ACTN|nr:DUF4397 domain-containing protein [Streptomyces flavofungini]MBJ3810355.1 DUF4397 domain-containing protein [Streptomyces flavofungini]MBJ3811979.1 DUF4397 domain-containing protein [Streptomyces flavofungini]GHC51164.1 lipoprotein [Streptomyces flavofungini]